MLQVRPERGPTLRRHVAECDDAPLLFIVNAEAVVQHGLPLAAGESSAQPVVVLGPSHHNRAIRRRGTGEEELVLRAEHLRQSIYAAVSGDRAGLAIVAGEDDSPRTLIGWELLDDRRHAAHILG